MKRKLKGVLGVSLTLFMVLSLTVSFAPVAIAADYEENEWGSWGLPAVDPGTDVGPIAVAPDGTLFAAVGIGTLGASGDSTATWSTTREYSGDYSALLDFDGAHLYVDFVPAAGTTGDDFEAAAAADFGFWYYQETESGFGPQLELKFEDPDSTDYKDITFMLQSNTTLGAWTQVTLASTFGEIGEWNGTTYTPRATVAAAQTAMDGSDFVLTKVRVELYHDPAPDRICYIDDVTIAGVTYNLEPSKVVKSEDDGYTWDDTELDPASNRIVDIAISPNYEDDELLYVGTIDGTVYRLEDAGEGDVIAIKDIVDSNGATASELYSMDVWTDEDDYNWILVGTDLDVLVLRDKTFEDWRDQELATGGTTWAAYEVAFAPDFDESELIWAVIDDDDSAGTPDDFLVTATASPGQWGQDIGEVDLGDDVAGAGTLTASPWVDIGFPDDYDSDPDSGNTNLWVAVSSPDTGDIFLIEGVDAVDGASNAISMFDDIGAEIATDFNSIAVSGDYGDEIILAGELTTPTVWISDDGGYGWDAVDKSPTGQVMTYVIMEAGVVWGGEVFDTDDGMAFAATIGDESAFSRSNDGGQVYNQVGLIDTELDTIIDLGFHPDFPDTAIFMMLTDDGADAYSLWLTENGDEDEPDYMRVLCGYDGAPGNLDADSLSLVEYAQDADAIYIYGEDETSDPSIWKSTDDGQTFGKKRSVDDNAVISDWVITEGDTIYAAASVDGFYMTTNSGLSWTSVDVGAMNDIALSPDFEDDETILLGSDGGGDVYLSDDGGDSFDDAETTDTADLTGDVFVAFDADYADEDADGYMLIYAGGVTNNIQVGEVTDPDDVAWDDLEDDADDASEAATSHGLVVAEDNALYVIDTVTNDLDRLLLHETNSEWESSPTETSLDDPEGLWLTPGSNVLWTIDTDTSGDDVYELWVLEDTLSGQVTLDSPKDGYQSDRLTTIRIAWDEMRGADEYQYKLNETSGLGNDIISETDDTDVNVTVVASSEYDWKVRVAPREFEEDDPEVDDSDTWHSRWSDEWTFNTALGDAPWAPSLYTPGGIWQYSGLNVELMPAFSWESAKNADSYQFVLADNAEFTSPLVNEKVPESAFNLGFELEYNSNFFWRVMAYNGNKAVSRWSDIGAFTTIEEPGAPPPPLPPPATVTQPAPAPIVIPTPIPPVLLWVIVGIGAALIIAVIILIIRTRRAV